MSENRFDILPLVVRDQAVEFYKTKVSNNFDSIERGKIAMKDVRPLDTPIREIIKGFATEDRQFYFLNFHNRVTGLITIGNLNCRQVQIYIFGLICDLERKLGFFINKNLKSNKIQEYLREKAIENEKIRGILEHYNELVKADLENDLMEHLFLVDFFNIISAFKLYEILDYSKKEWERMSSINDLRHKIAHPTRSLLDAKDTVERLWRRIERIEDLTFRLRMVDMET